MASEIDLAWTYVAGSTSLIDKLLADERIEALPADSHGPLTRVEPFVAALVERAVEELLGDGHTVVATSRGTVEAWMQRPKRLRRGALRTRADHDDSFRGRSGGSAVLHAHEDELALRQELSFYLTAAVIGLVGG